MIKNPMPALHRAFLYIMKHPCIFGFCFALGTIIIWWNFSSFAHASRKFHIRDMRLFPFSSHVKDIYNGSLETLGRVLRQSELRFVVYYAPWCAQSRKMVPEMGLAADLLKETYVFIAINCWVGSCKLNFTLQEFPKFFAYHSTFPPVEFTEPAESSRIVHFLQSIARPLIYVGNENSLQEIVSSNEAIVFGYFNIAKENNKRFSVFLSFCIENVNKDSRIFCGIVASSRIAEIIGFRKYGQVILRQILGKQWLYPSTLNFTSDMIFSWISKHHTQFAMKLSPTMLNLDHYISQLKRGPAVLLFVSHKPASNRKSVNVLHQFRYTAAVYSNCSEGTSIQKASELQSSSRFGGTYLKSEPCVSFIGHGGAKFCDMCQHFNRGCFGEGSYLVNDMKISENPTRYSNTNSCSCLQNYRYASCKSRTICCVNIPEATAKNGPESFSSIFNKVKRVSSPKKSKFSERLNKLESYNNSAVEFKKALDSLIKAFDLLIDVASKTDSNLKSKVDSTRHLLGAMLMKRVNSTTQNELKLLRERCEMDRKLSLIGGAHRQKFIIQQRANFSSHDFNGLRCKTNRSVNFFYLDLDVHRTMIRRLGINGDYFGTSLNHPILAIVDLKNEATFVMKESPSLTHNSMVNYITSFTNGKLQRHLGSSDQHIKNRQTSCISEVTSSTFEKTVLDDSKDVFLLYYAPWCGFCKPAQRVFLELARRFEAIDTLQFARINADLNELPYHYTVAGFPSFILFPMDRKSHSWAYPEAEPIRVKEVANFLSKHCSKITRKSLMPLIRTTS